MKQEYPIADLFYSIQGEGTNTGRPCLFIRLAGCNVGRRYPDTSNELFRIHQEQYPRRTLCHLADGSFMACDTEYTVIQARMTPEEIVERLKQMNSLCRYVSITGGEPLIHDLADLVEELVDSGYEVWGETSGTKVLPAWVQARMRWVVSPKYGYLPEVVKAADHVKLLVGADMHLGYLLEIAQLATGPVFLQPVESPSLVQSRVNLRMAIDLAYMHPAFRLSVQMHKHLNLP